MNSDIFDLRRFGLYTRQQFRDNWKMYGFGLMGITAAYFWSFYQEFEVYKQYLIFQIANGIVPAFDTHEALYGLTTMFVFIMAAESFKYFAIKTQAIHYLTLPVSTLERFVYPLLVLLPVAAAVSWAVWYVGDLTTFSVLKAQFPEIGRGKMASDDNAEYTFSVLFLGGCMAFMLGAVVLGRFNFFKIFGILCALGVILYLLQVGFLRQYFPSYDISVLPAPWLRPRATFVNKKSVFNMVYSTNEWAAYFWWVYAFPVLLLAATYLKMKEKQV